MLARIPGPAYLWIAILIFAASNSVVQLLNDLGAQHAIEGRNAISFCNLLFAGNACAVVTLFAIYRKEWTLQNLRLLSRGDWASLVALAVLTTALAPAFFFIALENTSVTNVVLIAQIEPPLGLALAWLVFRERIGMWAIAGAALCLVGVGLAVVLQPSKGEFKIGKGELFAAAAAGIFAVSTIIARPRLKRIPLGIFMVFRNALGTVVFFFAALYLYGAEHFMDLTSPFLWQWMLVYGGVIIVAGQLTWFAGLKAARSIDVSLATSATPVAGVLAALLILGERPMSAHYIGGGVLVLGILVGLLGARAKAPEARAEPSERCASALTAEGRTGFKGI
ncbi:MAG: DMT family transporter [Alphaproteobacteria bacterium]